MKKKLFFILLILIVIAFFGYQYMYKSHRDIASEEANFTTTVSEIFTSFTKNDSLANAKYLDKTIIIKGKVTNVDIAEKILTIDEKLSARFSTNFPENTKIQDSVTIKGRLIGFDDLLEEIQVDQSNIVK